MKGLILVVIAAAFATAHAGVIAGPQQPASPAVVQAAPLDSVSASAASNGDGGIVVWSASHRGFSQVVARRVDPSGNLLDDPPIALSDPGPERSPAVAWTGTRYIVAWMSSNGVSARVQARWVGTDGTLGPISVLDDDNAYGGDLAIACLSGRCVVAWSEPTAFSFEPPISLLRSHISAVVVGNDALLAAPPAVLYQGIPANQVVAVAGNGAFLIVADNISPDFNGGTAHPSAAMLDPSGSVTARLTVPSSGQPTSSLSAAYDGHEFILAFNDGSVKLVRISVTGDVIATASVPAALSIGSIAAWNGNLLATYYADPVLLGHVAILDRDGNALRDVTSMSCSAGTPVPLNSRVALILGNCGGPLSSMTIDPALAVTSSSLVAVSIADQDLPAIVAANGHEAMAVWSESIPDDRFHRTAVAMRLIDGVPQGDRIVLGRMAGSALNAPVSIASSGKSYLAAWVDDANHAQGKLFTPSGSIALTFPGHTSVDAAWDGEAYVVIHAAGENIAYTSSIHPEIVRVDESGRIVTSGESLGFNGSKVNIRCGGGSCLAWSDDGAAIVTGTARVPASFWSSWYTGAPRTAAAPVKGGFIVAQQGGTGIQWFRVGANGERTLPSELLASDTSAGVAAIGFGSGVLIAWVSATSRRITGAIVDEGGNLAEGPFPLTGSDDEIQPALTNGRLAYVRITNPPGVPRLQRVMTRSISVPPRHRGVAH